MMTVFNVLLTLTLTTRPVYVSFAKNNKNYEIEAGLIKIHEVIYGSFPSSILKIIGIYFVNDSLSPGLIASIFVSILNLSFTIFKLLFFNQISQKYQSNKPKNLALQERSNTTVNDSLISKINKNEWSLIFGISFIIFIYTDCIIRSFPIIIISNTILESNLSTLNEILRNICTYKFSK